MTRWGYIDALIMAVALMLAAMAMLAAVPAHAQTVPCYPREQVAAYLTGEKYTEQAMLELSGTPSGLVLQVYGNLMTGTWTIVGLPNPLMACVLEGGKKIKVLKPTVPGEKS